MKRLAKYLIISLLPTLLLNNNFLFSQKLFRSPVGSAIKLSANFGELRPDHFHSGIDIKTGGITGKKIYAAADGYISRINVSGNGFGKELYITHHNGYTTVYAHLSNFTPDIEAYIKNKQYEQESFEVNIYPEKNEFPVSKGAIIARSGNSGGSLGPHLHFEVRNTDNQHPVNPLLFNFRIKDNMNPVIERIYIYPLSETSHVDFSNEKKVYNAKGHHGQYKLEQDKIIDVFGEIGFGIETIDYLNGSWNKCAAFSIEVKKDTQTVYCHEMQEFSFSETRYVNTHIDYEEKTRNGNNVHQTFIAPNNKLRIYKRSTDRGKFFLNDTAIHNISIIVTDAYKNRSQLTFRLQTVPNIQKENKEVDIEYSKIMPYAQENSFSENGFNINIPEGALYDTLYFEYNMTPSLPGTFSPVHFVHNKYTPLHKYCDMSIVPDSIPEGIESKLLAARINGNEKIIPEGGEWDGEKLNFRTRNFGRYIIVADTVSPEIKPLNFNNDQNLTGYSELRVRITDDFSGIKSYDGTIDDEWGLFEYDPKNELLVYRFDKEYITKDKQHTLELKVTDNRDNSNTYTMEFYW